jgi:hypothetical protein
MASLVGGETMQVSRLSPLPLRAVFAASSSLSSSNPSSALCCSNTTPTRMTTRPMTWADLYVPRLQPKVEKQRLLQHRKGECVRKVMPRASLCQRISLLNFNRLRRLRMGPDGSSGRGRKQSHRQDRRSHR